MANILFLASKFERKLKNFGKEIFGNKRKFTGRRRNFSIAVVEALLWYQSSSHHAAKIERLGNTAEKAPNCFSCGALTMALRLVGIQNIKSFASRIMLKRRHLKCLHMGEHFSRGSLNEIELQTIVPLAGRRRLASSNSVGFPQYLSGPKEDFPMLAKAKKGQEASMKHWALRCREIIDQAYERYERNGTAVAILFRGLPNTNERDFSEWVNNLRYQPFAYVGGIVPRNEVEPNVSEGAQDDSSITFEPHNEMAYSPRFPKIFTISCLKKSQWGGETGICDNRDFYAKLDPVFVQKCQEKKVRYWNCLHSEDSDKNIYQSWQMRFQTGDKDKVTEFLKNEKYSYAWEEDTLFYWKNLLPTTTHVISGEQLWFNQISTSHASYYNDVPCYENNKLTYKEYPCHTTYGDGEEFEQYEIDDHRRCVWESAVGFDWQNGDILFLDQMIVQHSRLSFEGDRKVGVSLLNY